MNVYDFDGTIYKGDSTVDFYFFVLRRHPGLIRFLFRQGLGMVFYLLRRIGKIEMKERFFCFLSGIKDLDEELYLFWKKKEGKIQNWYLRQREEDDVIISASPRFLLEPGLKKIGISNLIASEVNGTTGRFDGTNCRGEEKVRRFQEEYAGRSIQQFYSDSLSDQPMAELAWEAFLVKGDRVIPWKNFV